MSAGPSRASVWGALLVVYVVWGSTYLGILYAIETIPVFLSMGIRFLLAGGLLYAYSIRRGDREGDRPGRTQWLSALVVGAFLFVGGNSMVAWAETRVDTGVAALLIAAVPLWIALFDRIANGQRLSRSTHRRSRCRLRGVALLAWPSGAGPDRPARRVRAPRLGNHLGDRIALCAPRSAAAAAARQLVDADADGRGTVDGARRRGVRRAQRRRPALAPIDPRDGLPRPDRRYRRLLRVRVAPPFGADVPRVDLCVCEPVVAVFLGWAILSEPLSARTIAAGAIILGAVALIITPRGSGRLPYPLLPAPAPSNAVAGNAVARPITR